jgi:hypothetical protein
MKRQGNGTTPIFEGQVQRRAFLTFVFKKKDTQVKAHKFLRSFSYDAPIAQCKFKIGIQSLWNDLFCRGGPPLEWADEVSQNLFHFSVISRR